MLEGSSRGGDCWISLCTTRSKIEVVEELEPELLVSTEFLLSGLVVGVHQTIDIVFVTTLVPLAIRSSSGTEVGASGSTTKGLTVEVLVLSLKSGIVVVVLVIIPSTVSIEVGAVHATVRLLASIISGHIFVLLWTTDNVGEVDGDFVDTVEVV